MSVYLYLSPIPLLCILLYDMGFDILVSMYDHVSCAELGIYYHKHERPRNHDRNESHKSFKD